MPDAGDCLLLEAVFQFGRGLQQAARGKQQESDYMKAVAKIIDMIFKGMFLVRFFFMFHSPFQQISQLTVVNNLFILSRNKYFTKLFAVKPSG